MNKTLIVINVILTILVFVWNVQSYSPLVQASTVIHVSGVSDFDGIGAGSGFQLQGKSGLIALADFVNRGSGTATTGVTFTLVGDVGTPGLIDFNNSGISPIGDARDSHLFRGIFDGSGVVIENLNIVGVINGAGLFGATQSATLKNITLSGVIVNSGTTPVNFVGSLVGHGASTIVSGITIRGNLFLRGNRSVGGLIGETANNTTSLTNVNVDTESIVITSTTTTNSYAGGLIGVFVGRVSDVSLTTNQLTLTGNSGGIGGFVGFNNGDLDNLAFNVSSLTITGTSSLGGLIGLMSNVSRTISNSYASIENLTISGVEKIGGFSGENRGTIESTYIIVTNVSITGTNPTLTSLGGFVGYNSGVLRNSYAAIENLTMSGAQWVGGFVGYNTSNIANTFVAIDSYAGSSIERFGEGGSLPQYVFTNNYYNSGLTGDAWYEYNDDSSDTASEINTIDASELLLILNSGSIAFRQVSSPSSEEFFPVLVESGVITLANQPRTLIYWSLEEEPAPEPEPTVTPPPSQPSPGFNNPSQGETYTYDPVFLTLEFSILESEVGEPFVFDYRGFSTFGPIIKDYTSDVVITGSVNENVVGTYPVTLSLSAEGLTIIRTFMIQIVDTTPPVISGPTNVRLFVGEAYEGQITASDNVDEPVTLTLLSTLDTSTAGITEVTWQATDASGNVSTLTQTVNVLFRKCKFKRCRSTIKRLSSRCLKSITIYPPCAWSMWSQEPNRLRLRTGKY
jgi:hypothetical protein